MSVQLALHFDEVPITCETQQRYHSISPCLAGKRSAEEQADALGLSYSTICRWLRKFREEGMPGLFPATDYPREPRGKSGEKTPNLFEVIAGKSILSFRRDDPEDAPSSSKCFALVRSFDKKPKRRLFDLLQSQGMQANQQVTFFSDGGDTVRKLQEYLNPDSEHILDWFHITMRITVLQQCARGLQKLRTADTAPDATDKGEESLERRLESVKHYLWHGNSAKALDRLQDLEDALEEGWGCDEAGEKKPRPENESAARMLKYVLELKTYITNNARFIVNYGERYRNGERISTGFAESTINQVVSKRMVKKQQMQWTPRGAHLLLQVRTQVLNEDWEEPFRTWYPNFRPVQTPTHQF